MLLKLTRMNRFLVIIPTYNEIENISLLIPIVMDLKACFEVLIVDDDSPDGTADAVKRLQPIYPDRVHLLERKDKKGLGRAYVAGFEWALSKSYDIIFEMDADFSHNPADLERLLEACLIEKADVVIGSRYIRGVNVVNWPLSRVLLSYFASIYVKFITGMKVHDSTAGFMAYRREVLEKIGLSRIKFVGYAFQIEMKYRCYSKNFKMIEIPIVFTDRSRGESKMNNGIIHEAIWGVISLRIKKLFGRL